MNSNHQPDDHERNDARLTAFALGELRGEELAEVSRFVDANPDARRAVEEIRELAAALTLPGSRTPHAPREAVHHAERDGCEVTGKKSPLLRAIETELAKEAPPMHATQPTVQPKKRDYRRIAAWSVVATTAGVLAVCLILPGIQPVREASRKTAANVSKKMDASANAHRQTTSKQGADADTFSFANDPVDQPLEASREMADLKEEPPAVPMGEDLMHSALEPSAPRNDLLATVGEYSGTGKKGSVGPYGGNALSAPPSSATANPSKQPVPFEMEASRSQVVVDKLMVSADKESPRYPSAPSDPFGEYPGAPTPSTDPRMQPYQDREKLSHGMYAPGAEQYEQLVENRFKAAERQPLSTFSIDVDTASYANIRRFLTRGQLPPPAAVRIEEMINYFRYDYSPPTGRTPFAVHLEAAECPWNGNHRLVRIGLKGKEIDAKERGPSNIVFLLDVSGSMAEQDKLPLVKQAMSMLVDQLTEDDRVAIVTYAGDSGVRLHSTNGTEKNKIRGAIESLYAGGSTHGSAGLQQAYEQAKLNFVRGGVNRVIWATDGDLNVGVTGDDELVKLITEKAKTGVFLTVLGVGTGNLKDAKLEKMADKGNGLYAYLDSVREAQKVLVEQLSGSLVAIAKDVKIQVEFNPAEVQAYRLVGYENRVMANKDFRDDKKDAGEIGAGHTVTALYEVVPAGAKATSHDGEPLKYQQTKPSRELSDAAKSGELLTVRLRYKEPDGEEATEIEFALKDSEKRFGAASADFRFAAAVASFGLILRNSEFRGGLTLAAVEEFAAGATGKDPGGYRAEFVDLVKRARQLSGK